MQESVRKNMLNIILVWLKVERPKMCRKTDLGLVN